jgi:uncharacterized phage infection (PIP) family protein YhgE
MTFGKIKQDINNILLESYSNKNKFKKLFKEFYNILKNNETIKEYYVTYSNIENNKFDDISDATNYLSESIDYLKTLDNDFSIAHDFILKHKSDKVYVKETLLENIDVLTRDVKSNLIEGRMNAKKYLVSHLLTKKSETDNIIEGTLPIKIYTNLIAKKFNKKYENLTEWEKDLVKTMIGSDENKLSSIEESIIKENLELVNNKINIGGEEIKEKLSKVKLKLESYSSTDKKDSIIKLIKLKSDLETI